MKLKLSSSRLPLISILVLVLSGCGDVGTGGSRSGSNITSNPGSESLESNKLEVPFVTLAMENNNIYLDWTQSNADQFRVLYWKGNNAPQEQITTGTEFTFPPLSAGNYTVVVEAYDDMGNSLFSLPVALEVV